MKGKTNSQTEGGIKGEKLNITLETNQSNHSDLIGAIVTISYANNNIIKIWEGKTITVEVPPYVDYIISVSDVEGYATPETVKGTASQDNAKAFTFTYIMSALKVLIKSNQGTGDSAISGVKATVKYGSTTLDVSSGQSIVIPSGTSGIVTFPEVKGYLTPDPVSFTHTSGVTEVSGEYKCEILTVNVSANEGSVSGYEVKISKQEIVGIATKYTRLEYIESTGTQYIDTGFKPNQDSRVVMEAVCPLDGNNYFLFGARTNITNNDSASKTFGFNAYQTTYRSHYYNGWMDFDSSINFIGKFKIDKNKNVATIGYGSTTHSYINFSCDYSLYLFAANTAGTAGTFGKFKLYSCQIYDNGTLVRDYIPALRSDGIAGLYDAVSDTFIPSKGADNFIAGTEKNEVIATQTSVTGTYKIPFGTGYSIEAEDVENYKAPEAQSFIAEQTKRTVGVQFEYNPVVDLSTVDIHGNPVSKNTANCYVIREAGKYKFPIAYGAAIKNGAVNAEAYTKNNGTYSHKFVNYNGVEITSPYIEIDTATEAASVQISIADMADAVTNLEIVDGNDCRYVQFEVPEVPAVGANAVISVKDASGVIMWNWHLWLWADDLTPVEITNATNVKYQILPVNLGSKWDEAAKTHIKNWFYQWGRPTPLLCPSTYKTSESHESFGALKFSKASKASNFQTGIKNPTKAYYNSDNPHNWFASNSCRNLWDASLINAGAFDNDVKKTVYDPCPVGFKVPNGNTFTGFSKTNVVGSFANGWKFKKNDGDTIGIFFPASGRLYYTTCNMEQVGSRGYVFDSSIPSQNYVGELGYYSSTVYVGSERASAACSVRPVKDNDLGLPTHKLTINVSGDTATPSGYQVKIHQVTKDSEGVVSLGDVIATQTTASATHELTWGTEYAIVASDVSGFVTPSVQYFSADANSRAVNVVYQKITHTGTTTPTNGVWIQDTDGYFHTEAEWDGKYTPNGVAVITSNCRFVIALKDANPVECEWDAYYTPVSNIATETSSFTAKTDYKGDANTTQIINQARDAAAANYCRNYKFPNGKVGYMGAAGEWQAALDNKAAIDSALSKCGGTSLEMYYWTSTQHSSNFSWYMDLFNKHLEYDGKIYAYRVRAFAAI